MREIEACLWVTVIRLVLGGVRFVGVDRRGVGVEEGGLRGDGQGLLEVSEPGTWLLEWYLKNPLCNKGLAMLKADEDGVAEWSLLLMSRSISRFDRSDAIIAFSMRESGSSRLSDMSVFGDTI